jgi:signal transduction histidine kinase
MSNTRPDASVRWYRSLFSRVAVAVIALVALMLAAEGALFVWLSDRTAGAMPARDPRQMAELVAADLSSQFELTDDVDLQEYMQDQYGHFFETLLVIMRDRRIAANHEDVSVDVLDAVRDASAQRPFQQRPRRFSRRGSPNFDGPPPPPFGRDRQGAGDVSRRPPFQMEFAAIIVGDEPVGRVVVLPGSASFGRILRIVGPTMAVASGAVLLVGGTLIALVVFGPARRRLQQMQETTERLTAGDSTARAPEQGGDEIAAVARSFNRMADELMERARALEASDTARRQLLADVSHELMTPLTAMRGYIETLGMSELQLNTGTRERYLRIVSEETGRLEHIIGDLLDLARLEGGGLALRREDVPVEVIFNRAAERHERELTTRDITLDRVIAPDAQVVVGDPDRLEQVLQNLVANALRFTPSGGRITLTSTRDTGGLRISVRDTGPGIPANQLAHIFDRFYKVDASRKASGGSGLGLSIARAIVERHGGSIRAHNDNGAVFDITLPVTYGA